VSSCLSVRPSVRLSQVGVLLKRLNIGSRKQRRTIVQGLEFSAAENLGKTLTELPQLRRPMQVGCKLNAGYGSWKLATFDRKRCQLRSVASLSHWASTLFVCSTLAVKQRVARVCQRQVIAVHWLLLRYCCSSIIIFTVRTHGQ